MNSLRRTPLFSLPYGFVKRPYNCHFSNVQDENGSLLKKEAVNARAHRIIMTLLLTILRHVFRQSEQCH